MIKALDPTVSGAAFGMAGATIMGDGRVVLILDVAALFEGKRRHAPCSGRARPPLARPRCTRSTTVSARSPSGRRRTRATCT